MQLQTYDLSVTVQVALAWQSLLSQLPNSTVKGRQRFKCSGLMVKERVKERRGFKYSGLVVTVLQNTAFKNYSR